MGPGQRWFWRHHGQLVFWLITAVGVGWLLLGPPIDGPRWWWPFEPSGSGRGLAQSRPAIPREGWTAVAKAAMPAVVNIASARTVGRSEGGPLSPFFADPLFRFFFPGPEVGPRRLQSLGSGVIVTSDGSVLTNFHVVEGAEDIRVTLPDRREFRAKFVGGDPKTDLAVLRLPGRGFPTLPLGDSDRVEVAEVVLAIGNPFGLSQTVTMGIVSAVGRANLGITDYEDFIQTDAAINPGNSGGALISTDGELIGINTAIFTESGGYMGIGFAVPVNLARAVMDQIIQHGRVIRGWLGVTLQELTPALARGLGLLEVQGILVADVMSDSPAARAGLRRGDVIVAFGDKPVDDVARFRNQIAQTPPGSRIRLMILRGGQPRPIEVIVGELAEPPARVAHGPVGPDRLGIVVADLTPERARRLGLPPTIEGVVVESLAPGGLGQRMGLRPGDVILEVNGQPIHSAREFARTVEQMGDNDLVLLVNRGGSIAYLAIERGSPG